MSPSSFGSHAFAGDCRSEKKLEVIVEGKPPWRWRPCALSEETAVSANPHTTSAIGSAGLHQDYRTEFEAKLERC